jgi:hypothetical protein
MTAEVHDIDGRRRAWQEKAHADVVDVLKLWLERAESGELDGLVLVGSTSDDGSASGMAGRITGNMLATLTILQHNIVGKLEQS